MFPTPQFKSINSLALSCLYSTTLSDPYMTTGKTIALTSQTFVGKVMSLLFNMLSKFVIALLPKSERLLTSWLQSPSDLGAQENSLSLFPLLPHPFAVKLWTGCHDLSFLNVEF